MRNILLITGCLTYAFATAQAPQWLWAEGIGNSENNYAEAITSDAQGNVFMTGYFYETMDMDPGPGVLNLTSNGERDVFVLKMDPNGEIVWAVNMGGTEDDRGLAVALDAAGNVCVAGLFNGTADMDPGAGVSSITSMGLADIVVVKLDPSGGFIWAKGMGGTGTDRANAIAVDQSNGDIYLTGLFTGVADMDPDAAVVSLTSAGQSDVFVNRLDQNGSLIWAKGVGGPAIDSGLDIGLNAGAVHVSGWHSGTADMDPGPGVTSLVTNGGNDGFVLKLNVAGDLIWAGNFGGPTQDYANALAVESNGDVIVSGFFTGTADMDPGTGVVSVISAGGKQAFVSKWSSAGQLMWVKDFGGTGDDEVRDVEVDGNGDIYLFGMFEISADLDPGISVATATAVGGIDVFVSKLEGTGDYLWHHSFGGFAVDVSSSMTLDGMGEVTLCGDYFISSITIGAQTLPNAGSYDNFIAKLASSIVTGVPEKEALQLVSISPNPAADQLRITAGAGMGPISVTVFDQQGRLCSEHAYATAASAVVDVAGLAEGHYRLVVRCSDQVETHSFMITR